MRLQVILRVSVRFAQWLTQGQGHGQARVETIRPQLCTAGDMEDILGSLPDYPMDSQAWEDYRPRPTAAADPSIVGAAPPGDEAPMVRWLAPGQLFRNPLLAIRFSMVSTERGQPAHQT
jgi:hypothetical protein